MNTSHNYSGSSAFQESSFLKARGYLHDLSKPEKEVLLSNLANEAGQIIVENFPDEEDITQVTQGSRNVLKFKDKIYEPEQCSGMGKVFLRKNLVKNVNECGKNINILTQDMFEDEHGLPLINTMFIIQYDYDLDKGFITIPDNSALVFAGGSISNGTIMLRNTLILPAGLDIEHLASVNIRGTYKEGSLVYLRNHLRLYTSKGWVSLDGLMDLDPRNIENILDMIAPFKIELTPVTKYLTNGEQDIIVSWNYNRPIDGQKLFIRIGDTPYREVQIKKCERIHVFREDPGNNSVSVMIIANHKDKSETKEIILKHGLELTVPELKITIGETTLLLDEEKLSNLITKLNS